MLKFIARNKYKLIVFIIGLYIVIDVVQHKGLTRVLLPKTFPAYKTDTGFPQNKNTLINQNQEWDIAVNKKEFLNKINVNSSGFECDVYFDTVKNMFDVHHDVDNSSGLNLDSLLELYQQRELKASIWLDFKNLNDSNCKPAVTELIRLRQKYKLTNKLLVESHNGYLLNAFSDSGFYTSYYAPTFNPYQINDDEIKQWVDSISSAVSKSKLSALSGYYYQHPFLHHYFPNYPILTWAANDRFSLVSWLFKRKIAGSKEIFIALYHR